MEEGLEGSEGVCEGFGAGGCSEVIGVVRRDDTEKRRLEVALLVKLFELLEQFSLRHLGERKEVLSACSLRISRNAFRSKE